MTGADIPMAVSRGVQLTESGNAQTAVSGSGPRHEGVVPDEGGTIRPTAGVVAGGCI
jgi:hypothetical protein